MAIGLHFKRVWAHPDWIWHNKEGRWYPKDDFGTKVAVYEDRVRGWFLDVGREQIPDSGFVVLMIALAYVEGNQQYREGGSSRKKSEKFFLKGAERVFGIGKNSARRLYREVRCGLFHDGITRKYVRISRRDFEHAVKIRGKELQLNPNRCLEAVDHDLSNYVAALRGRENVDLCANFDNHFRMPGDEA